MADRRFNVKRITPGVLRGDHTSEEDTALLHELRLAMEEGAHTIIRNPHRIISCLFDVLNLNYSVTIAASGNNKVCEIERAIMGYGASSFKVRIHKNFRITFIYTADSILKEVEDGNTPFLSRTEKYVLRNPSLQDCPHIPSIVFDRVVAFAKIIGYEAFTMFQPNITISTAILDAVAAVDLQITRRVAEEEEGEECSKTTQANYNAAVVTKANTRLLSLLSSTRRFDMVKAHFKNAETYTEAIKALKRKRRSVKTLLRDTPQPALHVCTYDLDGLRELTSTDDDGAFISGGTTLPPQKRGNLYRVIDVDEVRTTRELITQIRFAASCGFNTSSSRGMVPASSLQTPRRVQTPRNTTTAATASSPEYSQVVVCIRVTKHQSNSDVLWTIRETIDDILDEKEKERARGNDDGVCSCLHYRVGTACNRRGGAPPLLRFVILTHMFPAVVASLDSKRFGFAVARRVEDDDEDDDDDNNEDISHNPECPLYIPHESEDDDDDDDDDDEQTNDQGGLSIPTHTFYNQGTEEPLSELEKRGMSADKFSFSRILTTKALGILKIFCEEILRESAKGAKAKMSSSLLSFDVAIPSSASDYLAALTLGDLQGLMEAIDAQLKEREEKGLDDGRYDEEVVVVDAPQQQSEEATGEGGVNNNNGHHEHSDESETDAIDAAFDFTEEDFN